MIDQPVYAESEASLGMVTPSGVTDGESLPSPLPPFFNHGLPANPPVSYLIAYKLIGFLEVFLNYDSKFTKGDQKKTKYEVKAFKN